MQGDFFQVLRRVQKEERNKSSLARVDNDFYKQLRDYIKDLERSVASDPFGNEQLLLNNAQRIATEICELRESKITKAANNNIYRSFLLFKKDNPQFDLLDTTPLNLTDEEETLYFSLMDALKNHRYRISLDEYSEEAPIGENYEDESYDEDFDEDEESSFVEDSYESSSSVEDESDISDEMEDEISDALGESNEVLDRLNQIKNAKVITDETYENIDKQVANQMYPGQGTPDTAQELEETEKAEEVGEVEELEEKQAEPPVIAQESQEVEESAEVQSNVEEETKRENSVSTNPEDFYKNPDSQFVDLDKLEPNYDDDYYNSIAAGSNYAPPSDDDFNLIFAKPKKPKAESANAEEKAPENVEVAETNDNASVKQESRQSELGFSSGLDVKEKKISPTDGFNKSIDDTVDGSVDDSVDAKKDNAPKKPVDKTRGGLFARDEIENATVVLSEDVGELVGIDGKVYGPFLANDVVILPNITAQILIDNKKASLVKY
ncbi:MAG: DNA replication complex GINS family protein [Methanobrevibacter olleyae]|uniref:DNA replication complex GINS family protein n=1 Tax=Methanobrevibacter olleyae TaxID=294671 RepID=A0A8T3VPM3_METOL|nr:DNA replication complex GINS family protein [Methanobrevibacter olleyae]